MNYVKLFEAYTIEDYQKALDKVRKLVQGGKNKEEILSVINKYYSDDAKELDNLRIIVDRIVKYYSHFSYAISYNERKLKTPKKTSWGTIDAEYKYKHFYLLQKGNDQNTKNFISSINEFVESQKNQYNYIISSIKDRVDTKLIEFIFEKLFELIKWVNDTGVEKSKIWNDGNVQRAENGIVRPRLSHEEIITKINTLNDFDFENEVEELKKLSILAKAQVKKAINSI